MVDEQFDADEWEAFLTLDPEAQAAVDAILEERRRQREQAVIDNRVRELEREEKARERFRLHRLDRLQPGNLTEPGKAWLEKLREARRESLDDIPDPEPLIDGLLYLETVNYLVGASGAFKTITALDMAAHVGMGRDWCGMPTRKVKVLYVIAEGLRGMKYRKRAWEQYHNASESMSGVEFVPFAVQIADLEEQMPALLTMAVEDGFQFIIFDTQAMCTIGIDENSNEQMAVVIDAAQKLATLTQGCVLIVAHTGKAENGIRGASGQYANVNTVIAAKRKDSEMVITLSTARAHGGKQKDAQEIESIEFAVAPVEPSVVLAQGAVDRKHAQTPAPVVPGRYGRALLNLMTRREQLGVTVAELTRMAQDADLKTANGKLIGSGSVSDALEPLLREKLIKKSGVRFFIAEQGKRALREGSGDASGDPA